MQGIFQKENTDKALKYGIYRHLPTYEKIIRNLVSFYIKKKINIKIQNRYQEEYCSKFQFHVVQLKQIESATEEEKQTAKDWQQVEEIIRGNPYREAVKQEMYKMSQDEKERYLYLREEMAVSDEVSRMRTAIKEGIKRGIKLTKKVFQLSQKGCTIAQIAEKCNIEESEVKEILE